jgi:hypothetical protein
MHAIMQRGNVRALVDVSEGDGAAMTIVHPSQFAITGERYALGILIAAGWDCVPAQPRVVQDAKPVTWREHNEKGCNDGQA